MVEGHCLAGQHDLSGGAVARFKGFAAFKISLYCRKEFVHLPNRMSDSFLLRQSGQLSHLRP